MRKFWRFFTKVINPHLNIYISFKTPSNPATPSLSPLTMIWKCKWGEVKFLFLFYFHIVFLFLFSFFYHPTHSIAHSTATCPRNLPLHFHFAFLLYSDSLEAYFVFRFIKSEIVVEWERKYGFVAACYLKSSSGSARHWINLRSLLLLLCVGWNNLVVMSRKKRERRSDEGLVEFGIIIINGSHFHAFFVCAEIVMVISMKWSCGVGGGWEMYLM